MGTRPQHFMERLSTFRSGETPGPGQGGGWGGGRGGFGGRGGGEGPLPPLPLLSAPPRAWGAHRAFQAGGGGMGGSSRGAGQQQSHLAVNYL